TCCSQYCSPFLDIEQHFGSLGSFFKFEMGTGVYLMNPPYDEEIIDSAVRHLITALRSSCEITAVVVLPVWDGHTQKQQKGQAMTTKDFKALTTLQKSGFVRSSCVLGFNTHKFFDYYLDTYIKITDTHLFVVSNTNCRLVADSISNEWHKFSV